MKPYQFTIVRYIHTAASQEFVNVGVVLWDVEERKLLFKVNERFGRIASFFPNFDGSGYRQIVRQLTARFGKGAEEINGRAQLQLFDERPRDFEGALFALLKKDGSAFQWSQVMGGLADDPALRLAQLYSEFVERFEVTGPRERRDEAEIWNRVENSLDRHGLLRRLNYGVELEGPDYAYRFKLGWTNGTRQVIEPISLDYLNSGDIVDKANTWSGRLLNLSRGAEFMLTGVVSAPGREDLLPSYDKAMRILRAAPRIRRLVLESEFDAFIPEIERDLTHG